MRKKGMRECLAKFREVGDQGGIALALNNLGDLLCRQGDCLGAQRRYEEALRVCLAIQDKKQSGYALHGLGGFLMSQGNLDEAKKHEEALAVRAEMGAKGAAAESRLVLAEISIEDGHPAEAESAAREAGEEFRKENESDL